MVWATYIHMYIGTWAVWCNAEGIALCEGLYYIQTVVYTYIFYKRVHISLYVQAKLLDTGGK